MQKSILPEVLLNSGIKKYMPRVSLSTAQAFAKVHAFAKRMRLVILTVTLVEAIISIALLILYDVSKAPILRSFITSLSIITVGYLGFLWLRIYWRTRFVHYLLGEHWWWTVWLVARVIAEFTISLGLILFLVLVAFGSLLRRWRAQKMALEIQANRGRWDSLVSTSLRDITLGRFK